MAVATEIAKNIYAGNGTTGPFPYQFKIYADSHLEVIKISGAGVKTTLVLNVGYTVSGAGVATGGNVTLTTALATGEKLVIRRKMPYLQATSFVAGQAVSAAGLNNALDKLAMLIQQVREIAGRGLLLPPDTTLDILELPTFEAGKAIGVNSTGDGLIMLETPEQAAGYAAAAEADALTATEKAAEAEGSAETATEKAAAANLSALAAAASAASADTESGTYAPEAFAVANISSITSGNLHYMRIGGKVQVYGSFTITVLMADTLTAVRFSLPQFEGYPTGQLVAPFFGVVAERGGVTTDGVCGSVTEHNSEPDQGLMQMKPSLNGERVFALNFSYSLGT